MGWSGGRSTEAGWYYRKRQDQFHIPRSDINLWRSGYHGQPEGSDGVLFQQGNASVRRELLLQAMYYIIEGTVKEPDEVFAYICAHDDVQTRERLIDAAIALKLAMNLYDLV